MASARLAENGTSSFICRMMHAIRSATYSFGTRKSVTASVITHSFHDVSEPFPSQEHRPGGLLMNGLTGRPLPRGSMPRNPMALIFAVSLWMFFLAFRLSTQQESSGASYRLNRYYLEKTI